MLTRKSIATFLHQLNSQFEYFFSPEAAVQRQVTTESTPLDQLVDGQTPVTVTLTTGEAPLHGILNWLNATDALVLTVPGKKVKRIIQPNQIKHVAYDN